MARIRIEDLPLTENLTAEQEELIVGAGRPSFRPSFEALEDRQLLAAALGRSLLPNLVPPQYAPAHVGQSLPGQGQLANNVKVATVDQKDASFLRKPREQTRTSAFAKLMAPTPAA
jgi:hypothetical protein